MANRAEVISDCIVAIRKEYERCATCGERWIDCVDHSGPPIIGGGAEGPIEILEALIEATSPNRDKEK